ncbi:MAG: hypothetical protein AAFU68_12945 [Pseudomonadota bacterium]
MRVVPPHAGKAQQDANRFALYALALIAAMAVALPAQGFLAINSGSSAIAQDLAPRIVPVRDLAPSPLSDEAPEREARLGDPGLKLL